MRAGDIVAAVVVVIVTLDCRRPEAAAAGR